MDLKEEIKKRGLKITWLAEQIDLKQPELSMFLNGKRKFPEQKKAQLLTLLNIKSQNQS